MLTKKQQIFFDFIINCYKENKALPTIGFLKRNSLYKSYNTIYKYLSQLEKKNYIKLDADRKKIIYIKDSFENNSLFNIPVINENRFISISSNILKSEKKYLAIKLDSNKLNSYLLKKGDILIFEVTKRNLNNHLVLIEKDHKYQVFKYIKKDGFIHLYNDINSTILTNECIIGKCVSLVRETMD